MKILGKSDIARFNYLKRKAQRAHKAKVMQAPAPPSSTQSLIDDIVEEKALGIIPRHLPLEEDC